MTRPHYSHLVLAIPHAHGAPLEFSTKNYHKIVTDMTPCRTFGFDECGIYTDDTSMSSPHRVASAGENTRSG